MGSQTQNKDEFFPASKGERGVRLNDNNVLCPGKATEGHLFFSSELYGSLRDVTVLWVIVFVGYSEYFGNSFHLRKEAGSCRLLNIQFCKVDDL